MTDTSLLLMWTALPRGIDTSVTPAQARLGVLLSPRVSVADPSAAVTLADVPDLADWPARLAGLQFTVEVDPGTGAGPAAVPATVVPPTLDSALWQALLPGTTVVQDRVFDQDGLTALHGQSYGHSTMVDQLRSGYTSTFNSSPVVLPGGRVLPQHFPALAPGPGPRTPLLTRAEVAALSEDAARAQRDAVAADLLAHARAGTLPDAIRHARDLAARLTRLTGRSPGLLFPSDGTQAGQLGRLLAFHTVASRSDPADSPAPAPDGFGPELHSVITLLHDHPGLLSRLGLMIDLTVPAGNLPQIGVGTFGSAPLAQLRVTVTSGSGTPGSGTSLQASTTHYSPWTAFIRDTDQVFTPRPSTPAAQEMVAGLLNLALPAASGYTLDQVDTDGSWLKAANMTVQPDAPGGSGLPALRTTGPSLSRAGQWDVLQSRMEAAVQNEDTAFGPAPAPVTLFAEDLTRGWRVDIRDHADGVWRSLHERDATYSVPVLPDIVLREEGAVQPAGMLDSPDPQQATLLSVPESLARWEGWSLSVPRPGLVVGDDGPASLPSTPQDGGVPLTSLFTVVPGSLPRLRFGHAYDVRARTVDLGGGGLDSAGADAALQLLQEIDQPLPVLPAPGATFTFQRFEPVPSPVLVPREKATEGESALRLVIRSSRTETSGQLATRLNGLVAAATPDTGIRYLGVCERHLVPPKTSQLTAERAGLLDALAPPAAYLVCCKDKGGLADGAILDIGTGQTDPLQDVADPFTGGTRPAVELVPSGTSAYPVHHETALLLPYLPDWLAAGAVLGDLPGLLPGEQADVTPDGSLVVSASGVLPLGQAICPVTSVTTVPFAGPWPLLASLRLQLTEGSGPPAWDPTERVLSVQLPAGQTAIVRLSCALPPGALDLLGQWQWLVQSWEAGGQPVDAVVTSLAQYGLTWPLTPFREITLVHATAQPVLDPVITSLRADRAAGDTGIALYGGISLDASSTGKLELIASWTEPPAPGQDPAPSTAHVLDEPLPPDASLGQVLQPGSGGAPDVLAIYGAGVHQEFGDTKHRQVTYQAVASTRFAEYFPSGVDVGPTTATGAALTLDIPSSAVPPAPRLREAVPMWRWDRPADPSLPRRRYDAGVRLLLEPPWFASGEGEQLAVVLLDPASYPPDEDLRSRVTHWGADPIFGAPALPGAPVPASFPAAAGPPVPAVVNASQPVLLIPHAVSYDSDRGVYVCDIPVDPGGAYAPFIRLAVVRYQPSSLAGMAMSSVVQVPFAQVLPERQVTLTPPAPGAPDTFGLRVDGVSYDGTGIDPRPDTSTAIYGTVHGVQPMPPLISVDVQERLDGTSDEAGWESSLSVQGASVSGGEYDPPGPLWTGQVTLPATRTPGQFRILITEYQLLDSDPSVAYSYQEWVTDQNEVTDPEVVLPPPKRHKETVEGVYRPGSQRLVFADELII